MADASAGQDAGHAVGASIELPEGQRTVAEHGRWPMRHRPSRVAEHIADEKVHDPRPLLKQNADLRVREHRAGRS
jgi:hypothetical protein